MKQTATIALLLIVVVASSFAISGDDPRYKNLKVLPKNTTKQQMDSIMKHFNTSLGVKCNFCHVFNQEQKAMDFASDGNEHKGIARQMIGMTWKLNKKYFDIKNSKDLSAKLEVTCHTCHNGKAHPARFAGAPATAATQGTGGARPDSTKKAQ